MASGRQLVFIVRFDADNSVGTGHYSRCFSLGQRLEGLSHEVIYIAKHIHPNIERVLLQKGKTLVKVPISIEWRQEVEFTLKRLPRKPDAAILDLSTPYAFSDLTGVGAFLDDMRMVCKTVLFDGMGSNALAPSIAADIDIVVVPYLGATELGYYRKFGTCTLVGPKYFVFADNYQQCAIPESNIRKIANRLLVTLGGADPFGVTKIVIEAILSIRDIMLDIRVIVGPNFEASLVNEIKECSVSELHKFSIVMSPDSLAEHMAWADAAVSSSGLTKYELAMMGTPSLQISFSEQYAYINQYFVCYGSARHLGVFDKVTVVLLAQEIRTLLADYSTRRMMHLAGKALFDSNATDLLLAELWRQL